MEDDFLKRNQFVETSPNVFEKGNLKAIIFKNEDRMILSYIQGHFIISYECNDTFEWKFNEFANELKKVNLGLYDQNMKNAFDYSEKYNFLVWGLSNGMSVSFNKEQRMIEGKIRKYFDTRPIQSLMMDLKFDPVDFSSMKFKFNFNDVLYAEDAYTKYNVKGFPKQFMKTVQFLFENEFLHNSKKAVEELEDLKWLL